jgi:hypothetical protein
VLKLETHAPLADTVATHTGGLLNLGFIGAWNLGVCSDGTLLNHSKSALGVEDLNNWNFARKQSPNLYYAQIRSSKGPIGPRISEILQHLPSKNDDVLGSACVRIG